MLRKCGGECGKDGLHVLISRRRKEPARSSAGLVDWRFETRVTNDRDAIVDISDTVCLSRGACGAWLAGRREQPPRTLRGWNVASHDKR